MGLDRIIALSNRLPNWIRWGSWLLAIASVFAASSFRGNVFWIAVAGVSALFLFFANLPALAFDGPLPFSSVGIHARGVVHPWDKVVRVERAPDGRNLQAIVHAETGELVVLLRVRGARTLADFRTSLLEHAPNKADF